MRRRISWLVAATTSAVVLAFVVPLALMVRIVAEDRALAAGNDEARSVATLVSGLPGDPALAELVGQAGLRSPATTSVLLPGGAVVGDSVDDLTTDPGVRRASRGEAFTRDAGDDVVIYVPVISTEGTAVVRTTVDDELLRAGVYRAWVGLGVLALLLLGGALVIADRLGRRISEPVTDLAAVAQRLHEGDLDARATVRGPEETVELAETLNRLAERIAELLAAERAAVGDLSHRLRTPVTALRLDAESVGDPDLAGRLQEHIESLQRTIDAIVRDARRPLQSSLSTSCNATAVVGERAAFWAALAEDQGRPVHVELPDRAVRVGLAPADLTDMIDVLVDNVFAHTPDDAALTVRLREDPDGVVLEVQDTGPGLAATVSPHGPRPGTSGLGLHIVRRTAAGVGGHLSLHEEDPGTRVRVTLPRG